MGWPSGGRGPERDFVGYGARPPHFRWPDGSAVAVNVVVNDEEGAELNLLDGDG
jgi:allantoinase